MPDARRLPEGPAREPTAPMRAPWTASGAASAAEDVAETSSVSGVAPRAPVQHGSVTEWVSLEKAGIDASRKLWGRYVDEVVRACAARIPPALRRTVAAEDLAQEVFKDFFLGIRRGAFPRLENRADVRQILGMLAERIAIDHRRHHLSLKAGGGKVMAFAQLEPAAPGMSVGDARSPSQGPADEADLRALLISLVPDLTDPLLQDLVCDRIMGFSIAETAGRRGISTRSVIRKLQLFIRSLRARGLSAS